MKGDHDLKIKESRGDHKPTDLNLVYELIDQLNNPYAKQGDYTNLD